MIYLLFPTKPEFGPLASSIEGGSRVETGLRQGVKGVLAGREVMAVVSGAGQANTAQAMTAILEGGQAGLVVLGGCAGAFHGSGLRVGDVAVATEEIYADLGVQTPGGWTSFEETGLPLLDMGGVRRFNRFPLSLMGVEKALARPGVFFGAFLTVSTVSGALERGNELYSRYPALCENMEGAAAAQVAALYGAPFLEVRGISNMVEDRDREGWDVAAAAANCARVIEDIVRNLDGYK